MTRRPKVWEPREGTSDGEEMPEWEVSMPCACCTETGMARSFVRATHAWDAWLQVEDAPAFGSCRVRRVVE